MVKRVLLRIARALSRAAGNGHRKMQKNLCCEFLEKVNWIGLPNVGIVRLNLNYCFVCGNELRQDGQKAADMTVKRG